VVGHVDGESSVGDLEESEGSGVVASEDSSSSGKEVSPDPLLMWLVLAVVPGQDSVLSGGPAVWGQAPSVHLEVLSLSENLLVSSALVDGEGGVASNIGVVADLASKNESSSAGDSEGLGSAIIDEVSSPVS